MATRVVVYSTPTCPHCKRAKQFLEEKGIEYEDVDVSTDQAKARELVEKTGQMVVPVLDIGGTLVVGFNEPEISRALGLA